jgi:hypothetical protein
MKLSTVQILVTLKLATINDGRVRFFWERSNQRKVIRSLQRHCWTTPSRGPVTPQWYYLVRNMVTGSNLSWRRYANRTATH